MEDYAALVPEQQLIVQQEMLKN